MRQTREARPAARSPKPQRRCCGSGPSIRAAAAAAAWVQARGQLEAPAGRR
jgi:hypothetical protein